MVLVIPEVDSKYLHIFKILMFQPTNLQKNNKKIHYIFLLLAEVSVLRLVFLNSIEVEIKGIQSMYLVRLRTDQITEKTLYKTNKSAFEDDQDSGRFCRSKS